MKRNMFLVMMVTVLAFAAFTTPARAQDGDDMCEHSGATIGDLRACFEHAVSMGHITNRGIARSFFAKLDAAQSALDAGETEEAVAALGALINQLKAVSGKQIDPHHAEHMIAHTQRVIDALN